MMTLQDVIEQNSGGQPNTNSLQLVINRFAYRYDAGMRPYIETTLLRLLSGGVQTAPSAML
jgi:hypothetical protein